VTPAVPRGAVRSARTSASTCTGSVISASGMRTRSVSTSSGCTNPGSTPHRLERADHQPEPTSRTSARATSPTTRTLRTRWRPRPSLADRPPSCSADTRGAPSGAPGPGRRRPRTDGNHEREQQNGGVEGDLVEPRQAVGAIQTSSRMPAAASPGRGRRRGGRGRCSHRGDRGQCASGWHEAERTASSCCRASARTRNRFATFAQAMRRTSPTVPKSTHNTRSTSPITSADNGRTRVPCGSRRTCRG